MTHLVLRRGGGGGGGTGRHCFPSSSELKRRPGYGSYWLYWYSNFFRLSTHERVHTHMKPYGKHLSLISTKIRAPPNTAIKVPPPHPPLLYVGTHEETFTAAFKQNSHGGLKDGGGEGRKGRLSGDYLIFIIFKRKHAYRYPQLQLWSLVKLGQDVEIYSMLFYASFARCLFPLTPAAPFMSKPRSY